MDKWPECPKCGVTIDENRRMIVERTDSGGFKYGCADCMAASPTRLSDF